MRSRLMQNLSDPPMQNHSGVDNDADDRDWNLEQARGDRRYPVKSAIRWRIEDVIAADCCQPPEFSHSTLPHRKQDVPFPLLFLLNRNAKRSSLVPPQSTGSTPIAGYICTERLSLDLAASRDRCGLQVAHNQLSVANPASQYAPPPARPSQRVSYWELGAGAWDPAPRCRGARTVPSLLARQRCVG